MQPDVSVFCGQSQNVPSLFHTDPPGHSKIYKDEYLKLRNFWLSWRKVFGVFLHVWILPSKRGVPWTHQ